MRLTIRAWSSGPAQVGAYVVPLHDGTATLNLRCLPGASALHVHLETDGVTALRAELDADPGEEVAVYVRSGESGPSLACPERPIRVLSPRPPYEPLDPLTVAPADDPLDVLLLIDGTSLVYDPDAPPTRLAPLVGHSEKWPTVIEAVRTFLHALTRGNPSVRVGWLLFGDHGDERLADPNLQPSYLLFPQSGPQFHPLDELDAGLAELRPSAGADFVDALADALEHAATQVRWRQGARRLVLLLGNSPGHSLVHPLPPNADGRVRETDVDCAADHLHQRGVLLCTLFHDFPTESGLQDSPNGNLLAQTAEQYARLASLPSWSWTFGRFDPQRAAQIVRDSPKVVGRGPSVPELLSRLEAEGPVSEVSSA